MRQSNRLRLVKALRSKGIILFWGDLFGAQIGPNFPSLPHAEEWWRDYQHASYTGAERCESAIDRRKAGSRSRVTREISHYP